MAKDMIKFKSKGYVYGQNWGGGSSGYPAVPLVADTKEELLKLAQEKIDDGSLDSGMGYKSLDGALLIVTKVTTKMIDGKAFINEETETEIVGGLDNRTVSYLYEIM